MNSKLTVASLHLKHQCLGAARLEGQYDEDGDGGQQEEQQQAAPAEEEQQPTDEVDVAEGGEEELADTAQGAPEAQPGESQPGRSGRLRGCCLPIWMLAFVGSGSPF